MENSLNFLIDALNSVSSVRMSGGLLVLKIIFIFLGASSLVLVLYFLKKTRWLTFRILIDASEFFSWRPYGSKKMAKTWDKILKKLETGREAEYKLAIIEADSLLAEVLERIGYKGESTGDKLKKLTAVALPNIGEVLEAHKIRNNMVHDPDYILTLDEAKMVLGIYEKALSDLDAF